MGRVSFIFPPFSFLLASLVFTWRNLHFWLLFSAVEKGWKPAEWKWLKVHTQPSYMHTLTYSVILFVRPPLLTMCNCHPLLGFLSASWNTGSWVLVSTSGWSKEDWRGWNHRGHWHWPLRKTLHHQELRSQKSVLHKNSEIYLYI